MVRAVEQGARDACSSRPKPDPDRARRDRPVPAASRGGRSEVAEGSRLAASRHDRPRHRQGAKGPALAQSELGGLRFDRATPEDFDRWFLHRVPLDLAPATRKRNRSIQRQLITYAIGQGWAEERLLACCPTLPDSEPCSAWLYPEEVAALNAVLAVDGSVDPYERFMYDTVLDTGVRCEELCAFRRSDADRRAGVVRVRGKGRGDGKDRTIPVDDVFFDRWDAHADRYGIAPNGWMLFSRPARLQGSPTLGLARRNELTRHASAQAIRKTLRRLQAHLESQLPADCRPRHLITPKVLRRTYACLNVILHALGLGGLDLVSLQGAMGHERLETTQVYLVDVADYLNRIRRPMGIALGAAAILNSLAETGRPSKRAPRPPRLLAVPSTHERSPSSWTQPPYPAGAGDATQPRCGVGRPRQSYTS